MKNSAFIAGKKLQLTHHQKWQLHIVRSAWLEKV